MSRRILLIALAATAFGLTGTSPLRPNFSVYVANMAQRNYKTPVGYDVVRRSGNTADVNRASYDECLRQIQTRVKENKRNGSDFECFFIVSTARPTLTPPPTEVDLLSLVAGGRYGKWQGWMVYWTPSRNKGFYYKPSVVFQKYGN